ncbi:MAG TPA: ectonucleotide pyrophosphatase/phosphodiesterase, partial [Flavitalea sp.]|nr:ectonucleotide pyrophosphatase/phosphodiesterase [Flavitalea sp.]
MKAVVKPDQFALKVMQLMLTLFVTAVYYPLTAQDTTQKIITGRFNDTTLKDKPYVILISVDGFRYDYAKKYNAVNLLRLGSKGVTGDGMQPAFPSLTFPNHYSIVTGLYPAHHGLVDNFFYDRDKKEVYNKNYRGIVQDSSWYSGTPLWVLAEKQKMLTAAFYWVGAEAAIQGTKPTYGYNFSRLISVDQRISIVENWLGLPKQLRPHLICLYFYEVDDAGHKYGPDSDELALAVRKMDTVIGKLVSSVEKSGLPVNFVVLSDHGMMNVDYKNPIRLPGEIDKSKFVIPQGDALLQLYAKEKSVITPTYKALRNNANGFRVYLKNELPHRWHYGGKDDRWNRVGDIVLIPEPPLIFNITNTPVDRGKHGFDPARSEMMATFFAWGPAFKTGVRIKAFDNVHVYPMIARILGLTVNSKIDGKISVLQPILK